MHVRRVFESTRLHLLAAAVYQDVARGEHNAIYRLSRFLTDHGLSTMISGTQLKAVSAGSRARYPEQIIFDLRGGDLHNIGGVANIVHVTTYGVAYYLDSEAAQEFEQQENRHAAIMEASGSRASDRTEAEDTMLRDRS